MQHVLFLLLRRLRTPIITIIVIYALSILGFVLIPGIDDQGNPWQMDFFHAFYFVSFMGSTIGFGEIPYPFTAAQRMWATFTMYGTVIGWLYSIGTIFALFQDPSYRRLLKRSAFKRRVRRLREPFYLICGYGYTGQRLVHQLDSADIRTVVIDSDQLMIDELEADETGLAIPGICGDCADPEILNAAGIQRPDCIGVVAVTDNDHTNLSVAIDAKLIDPSRPVIRRSESKSNTANLASFGTDYIIDPFDSFAEHLVNSLTQPFKHIVSDLIFNPHHRVLASPYQNTQGRWLVCGYGRLGKAIEKKFKAHQIPITFIEMDPESYSAPEGTILGIGTDVETLQKGGVGDAVGIVAGTLDDADNLSIIITARDINPRLITIARQNLSSNKPVFRAANVNMIMEPVRVIANEIFVLIKTPLLMQFIYQLRAADDELARALLMRISDAIQDQPLDTWSYQINEHNCPAIHAHLSANREVLLDHLVRHPRDREDRLPALPLMLKRGENLTMVPEATTSLQEGDEILFGGRHQAQVFMNWTTDNFNVLGYILSGTEAPGGALWRWLSSQKKARVD